MSKQYRIAVVQFPGSNCERETKLALKRCGLTPVDVMWSASKESLNEYAGFVLVGGFSYEDRLSAGVIAALSPIIDGIKSQAKQGKPVLGICNGAQILVAAGLVPGISRGQIGASLHQNIRVEDGQVLRSTYYNDFCDIKPMFLDPSHAFTNAFEEGESIHIPFAHAEGRFVIPQDLLNDMIAAKSSLFQYQGNNPNGSDMALAAISNKAGNVMAMMPHPERVPAGDKIFISMKNYLQRGDMVDASEDYDFSLTSPKTHTYAANEQPVFVQLIIEDNTAKSLQLILNQQGILVDVNRYRYVGAEVAGEFDELLTAASQTTLLYNDAKERLLSSVEHAQVKLVIEKECSKIERLNGLIDSQTESVNFHINTLGIVYGFDGAPQELAKLNSYLEEHHLIYNPYVEDCYDISK